jgi:hypothetical protein
MPTRKSEPSNQNKKAHRKSISLKSEKYASKYLQPILADLSEKTLKNSKHPELVKMHRSIYVIIIISQ